MKLIAAIASTVALLVLAWLGFGVPRAADTTSPPAAELPAPQEVEVVPDQIESEDEIEPEHPSAPSLPAEGVKAARDETSVPAADEAAVRRTTELLLQPQRRRLHLRTGIDLEPPVRDQVISQLRARLHGTRQRYDAAFALWLLTRDPVPTIEVLLDGFAREPRSTWGNSWQYLCGLLSMMGSDALGAVPRLLELYEEGDWRPEESDWIFHVFAKVGPEAKEALPLIREAVEHEHPKIRTNAALALWAVSGETEKPVAVLTASLAVEDPSVRIWAAQYLGGIGTPAESAASALLAATESKHEWYGSLLNRLPAAVAHWRVTGQTRHALPVLTEGLAATQDALVIWAAEAIGEMGKKGSSALPALRRARKARSGEPYLVITEAIKAVASE